MVGRRIEMRCINEHAWKQDVAIYHAVPNQSVESAIEQINDALIIDCPVCGKTWVRVRAVGLVAMYS